MKFTKPALILSTVFAASFSASATMADTTITSSLQSISAEIEGTTYSGALATTVSASFDIADNIVGMASFSYLTASGAQATLFDAGVGYTLQNNLNAAAGTGSKIGAGVTLSGNVLVAGQTAISKDFIVGGSLATPLTAFGSVISYAAEIEYVPWGLVGSYEKAEANGYDVSVTGFGIGYRTRF